MRIKSHLFSLLISILLLVGIYVYLSYNRVENPKTPQGTVQGVQFGRQTKTTGCRVNGAMPDQGCTPGSIINTVTKDQVCTPGYSKSVRNVSQKTKNQIFSEYGIASHSPGEFEVDHLISLELGGSNDTANLWPEAAEPRPGFHEKDKVENFLHDRVCRGEITLQQAQQQISSNWLAIYQTLEK